MFAGVLFGIYSARLWETRLLGLIVLTLMLSIEAGLTRLVTLHPSHQFPSLI